MLLEHHEQEKHAKAVLGLIIINRSKTIFAVYMVVVLLQKKKIKQEWMLVELSRNKQKKNENLVLLWLKQKMIILSKSTNVTVECVIICEDLNSTYNVIHLTYT